MNNSYYYIYYLIDPRNNQPFYVGKGRHVPGRTARWQNHITEAKKWDNKSGNFQKLTLINEILKDGLEPVCSIVVRVEDELTAFSIEQKCINELGRLTDGSGVLTNLTQGGEGITSKRQYDTEKTQLRREKMLGKNNPMFGKCHSIESKNKMSDTRMNRLLTGDIIPNKHTESHKQKLRNERRLGKARAKRVNQLCPTTGAIIQTFESTRQAGLYLDIKSWRNISFVCNKHPTRKVGGFLWVWD